MKRPYVWQMIKEAVNNLNGKASYTDIRNYIQNKWNDVNPLTINAQIIVLTVNHNSRIHYPENQKPRLTNSGSVYDFLYSTGRGKVIKYDIIKHGVWEIFEAGNKKFKVKEFQKGHSMNTFLFAWNPEKWNWENLEQNIEQLENTGKASERWSCASHKKIKLGDRAFLVRLGSEPRGIFASGYVASYPFIAEHWKIKDKEVPRILIDFDILLNPNEEPILELDILKKGKLKNQNWTPQSSGISIKPEIVEELEAIWFNFIATQEIKKNPYLPPNNEESKTYTEGALNQIIQTRYERNPHARAACISHYGYSCSVCQLNFEKRFGKIGKDFIHVHHLTQISMIKKKYVVDPIKDLRPVCPNCHAMLHRQKIPLTIEELKTILTENSK